ncbi:uncharacterized protein HaLaN_15126 [Haematococcus lacustris]|uniref:Uncharacterized protein n=1 Tax=Haematococcus lacustris TaxID=44745 RepID=A0A699ZAA1_HAELA|nr:uncharacterized protein HaLaN_15126 [Haematococcus lacustris]
MLGRQTTSGRTADPGARGQHSLVLHGISVGRRRLTLARSAEPFNESAAQVKRLISRDRKEFLGNDLDILDKYQTEFGEAPAGPSKSSDQPAVTAPVKPVQPAKRALPADNPFGKPVNATPFPKPPPPPKSSMEPVGLRPDMGPDPIVKEKAFSLLENITLTQVLGGYGSTASDASVDVLCDFYHPMPEEGLSVECVYMSNWLLRPLALSRCVMAVQQQTNNSYSKLGSSQPDMELGSTHMSPI